MQKIKIKEILEIAKYAGDIAMDFYDKKYITNQKENETPVTEADIAINDYLIKELEKYNHPILSEEVKDDFKRRKSAELVWIIDPLDGTADFIQKTGEFSIMIGLINKKGESILGVVYAPALGEIYWAEKGKGAFFASSNENIDKWLKKTKQIQISEKKFQNGKILVSRNHLGEYEQEIAKKYNMIQIPAGSAGLKICWIARGNAELYINSSNKSGVWDICAGDIILTEAGGKITDKNQNKILYNKKEIMLLNGYIASN